MRLCLLSNRIVRVGCPIPLIAALFTPMGSAQIVEHRLTASDGADVDFFGQSVAIDGDRAVIGAPLDDDLGDNSGAAYIFERQGDGSWLEIDKLTSSDGGTEQRFAQSVALSGDYVVVGVPSDGEVGINGGAAYAFERQGDGSWLETDRILPSDGVTLDFFGFSAAVEGEDAVIGAYGTDTTSPFGGALYAFTRQSDGTWTETAKLEASDGQSAALGIALAFSQGRVLGGADASDNGRGAAYLYENVFPVPIELTPDAPAGYRLTGVYPNPVVGRARFELSVARPQNVRIEVYDMLGRRRAILYDALIAAHSTRAFPFDTDSWASGTYLLRVSGETFSTAKTLTVLK